MKSERVKLFMELAGQPLNKKLSEASPELRALGAQLLLSETLEYVIKGLGVELSVNGQIISDPNSLNYVANKSPDALEMIDGLADVAYTMYWNMLAFGLKLEEAFELVAENNLEKFVYLSNWSRGAGQLEKNLWSCDQGVSWPSEVVKVEVLEVAGKYYAAGKDASGKVRKPSSYRPVNLLNLI